MQILKHVQNVALLLRRHMDAIGWHAEIVDTGSAGYAWVTQLHILDVQVIMLDNATILLKSEQKVEKHSWTKVVT